MASAAHVVASTTATLSSATQHAYRKVNAVQRTPLGRRILKVIQNLCWVVPMTVLIWLYAERDLIVTQQGVAIPITVLSERSDRTVSLVTPVDHMVFVDIQGPRKRIDDFRRELAARQGIQIIVPAQTPLGSQVPLPALDAISASKLFSDPGISAQACTPNTIELKVDEIIDGEVRPQAPDAILSLLDGPVIFDPPTVKLRGPRSALGDLSRLNVLADITPQMLPKTAGEQEIAAVPVNLATNGSNITLSPTSLRARVKIKPAEVKYTIDSVPVFVAGPVSLLDKYRVSFPNGPFMPRITVTGPEQEINRIRSKDFVVRATLEIKQKDADERLPRAPVYTLPPGVTVSEEDRARTIVFDLTERARPE